MPLVDPPIDGYALADQAILRFHQRLQAGGNYCVSYLTFLKRLILKAGDWYLPTARGRSAVVLWPIKKKSICLRPVPDHTAKAFDGAEAVILEMRNQANHW